MAWSKQKLVKKAFGRIGLNYTFDVETEEFQEGLSTLDAMMAKWYSDGIRSGYAMSSTEEVDGTVDSGLSDTLYLAVYSNLAMMLASDLGRQVSQTLAKDAKDSYNRLLANAAIPTPTRLLGNTPLGAGNKGWRGWDRVFVSPGDTELSAGGDGPLEFNAGGTTRDDDSEGT